jgi:hypothetical protein
MPPRRSANRLVEAAALDQPSRLETPQRAANKWASGAASVEPGPAASAHYGVDDGACIHDRPVMPALLDSAGHCRGEGDQHLVIGEPVQRNRRRRLAAPRAARRQGRVQGPIDLESGAQVIDLSLYRRELGRVVTSASLKFPILSPTIDHPGEQLLAVDRLPRDIDGVRAPDSVRDPPCRRADGQLVRVGVLRAPAELVLDDPSPQGHAPDRPPRHEPLRGQVAGKPLLGRLTRPKRPQPAFVTERRRRVPGRERRADGDRGPAGAPTPSGAPACRPHRGGARAGRRARGTAAPARASTRPRAQW